MLKLCPCTSVVNKKWVCDRGLNRMWFFVATLKHCYGETVNGASSDMMRFSGSLRCLKG